MKKRRFLYLSAAIFSFALTFFGQEPIPSPVPTRPRVVGVEKPTPMPTLTPSKIVVVTNNLPTPTPTPVTSATPTPLMTGVFSNPVPTIPPTYLTLGQIRAKLAEAKREMTARPLTIAMTDGSELISPLEIVRVAFYDYDTKKLDYVVLPKSSFLTKDIEFLLTSQNSKVIRFRTIRPNGTNTPVVITDSTGKPHLPLMVQYPVVRGGAYIETAYYISTHPGLITPEIVNAGKLYIKNTIDVARQKLQQKGFYIAPKIADMAERLCVVEHVDHYRFRTEYHPNIYNDIFALYALNEGQTYRYAVSSAGAGGMVQMIPSTYRMIRSLYPGANLHPDFVTGMQNHDNAAQAMLLYIQMTYNDLLASPTIINAIETGIANEFELMAAGYNSNPARLPGYIKRGGANWRNLIPRETRIYLQINASMDRYVPIIPRTK